MQINKLEVVTRVRAEVVAQRQLAVTALQGDIAWVSLVHRIADGPAQWGHRDANFVEQDAAVNNGVVVGRA